MHTTTGPSPVHVPSPPGPRRRHRGRLPSITAALAVAAVAAGAAWFAVRTVTEDGRRDYLAADSWPVHGQAAYAVGDGDIHAGPGERPVPIASLAKVMTALLVLRAAPLRPGTDGFRLTIGPRDVADYRARERRGESVVPVRVGEVLTERDALAAVLLPSANNVAVLLARRMSGSVPEFVRVMNGMARALGMTRTRYTDPSGYAATTRSTAADQLLLARSAMHDPTLARLVATRRYRLPVAGTVRNTDELLGTGGFVGIKTGSDDAAGGCFMFRAHRLLRGRLVDVTGVVLGQPGRHLLLTGQYAARQLVESLR